MISSGSGRPKNPSSGLYSENDSVQVIHLQFLLEDTPALKDLRESK